MNYNVLANILKKAKAIKLGRGAEIGVLYADTSAYLLNEFPSLLLHSIDPWLPYEEVPGERNEEQMKTYENRARNALFKFGARSQIMKMFSSEAAPLIPDQSLDFVFIDALHTYEAVKEDIALWYNKVRPEGIFAGHDYSWDGVKQAVHEFDEANNLTGFYTPVASDIWFFIKE